jgi:hypothetical protein
VHDCKETQFFVSAFEEFERAASEIGLLVKENKTKHLTCMSEDRNISNQLQIGEYKFEKIEAFKYLGSIVTTEKDVSVEIQARLMAANVLLCLTECA